MGSKYEEAIFYSPQDHSYFLFGPRGTGKSTWLKSHYVDAYWVDLLKPELFRLFSANPERLRQILEELPGQKTVVLDEIQKVPDLLNVVHEVLEEKRTPVYHDRLDARKLKKEGVNLLGGRALLRHMPPFFAAELGAQFDLKRSCGWECCHLFSTPLIPKRCCKLMPGFTLKRRFRPKEP